MTLSQFIDRNLQGMRPSTVVYLTAGILATAKVAICITKDGAIVKRINLLKWRIVRHLLEPIIRKKVNNTLKDVKLPSKEGEFKARQLPEKGLTDEEVLGLLSKFHDDLDVPYEEGCLSGVVYHGGQSHTNLMNRAMELFQWSNPLHAEVFGAARKMEAEVASMVVHMFNGHLLPDACGVVTTGGTESILMAMKAYRDWGRAKRGITQPNVIVGITAHPAFQKGADYFNLDLVKVPVDQHTQRVDAKEMEKYINYNTVAIVGSAPTFPHGIIDPIEELSEIACRHNIGLHVDCCLGGFIVPFMEKAGYQAPIVDFRLPGVTSISCDTHKYGYAPKGTSTVLYRTQELRSYQFCCVADWPGGIYCSPSVCGSKPGNTIAAAWAAMTRIGVNGYVECCRKIVDTRAMITTALSKLPFLHIFGNPIACVFAFGSNVIDIFVLAERLKKRGWVLNYLQFPSGVQFSLTLLQTQEGVAERFIGDVTEIGGKMYAEYEQALKEGGRTAALSDQSTIYGSQQKVADRTIIQDCLKGFLNLYYSTEH
ncbi:putative sphingosine phosphate lyase-like protein [Trypanosoma vivax]|uniref:sphinganine-1-phosphate aldolase n=1 Tax=Trypanosoma vivax (strain Y486) TaxID=1055687 RepID=G0TX31_TRYVY|nr:putative sphingosine phosphate lyase-like protein [Trypanosoma vivax]CCC48521.1 putative sphingosine phosphate lyase-like protein [Trypanosoma vivax Y486]